MIAQTAAACVGFWGSTSGSAEEEVTVAFSVAAV
jgi:hypothetical protein